MDMKIKEKFGTLWGRYFNDAELPITFYYTDEEGHAELVKPDSGPRCVIGAIAKARRGDSFSFDADSIGCFGGRRYLGFAEKTMPNFEYFLSCGIPGRRYRKGFKGYHSRLLPAGGSV